MKERVDEALGRLDPDWKLRFGCPACGFEVDGEPPLIPARLHAMDGNNSAKRIDGSGFSDPRVFRGAFEIPREEVEKYKDEVKARPMTPQKVPCPDRFKAANTIDNPSALDTFDQTGIFLITCRHHIVEKFAPMVKSGEL